MFEGYNEREYVKEQLFLNIDQNDLVVSIDKLPETVHQLFPKHRNITISLWVHAGYKQYPKIQITGYRKRSPQEIDEYDSEQNNIRDAELKILSVLANKYHKTIL